MRDPLPEPFVCPNRECHRQRTADAHKLANMGGRLNELEHALRRLQFGLLSAEGYLGVSKEPKFVYDLVTGALTIINETLPSGRSGGMSAEQMRLAYRVEHGDGLTLHERKEAAQLVRDGALYRQCAQPEALALLRELNDALVIPGWLQPRVDAVLDRADIQSAAQDLVSKEK